MRGENVEKILLVISKIPRGKVATYGQIARLAGIPGNARQVGQVLRNLPDPSLPWHRVVNSKGEISSRNESECESYQRELLAQESVTFDATGRVSLDQHRWQPNPARN